jgi:hypothetical protein
VQPLIPVFQAHLKVQTVMETGIFLIYSLNGWSFNDPKVCGITVVSGRMTNIHPEATELINPEMASPKVFFIF